jgi:hypothetical protein
MPSRPPQRSERRSQSRARTEQAAEIAAPRKTARSAADDEPEPGQTVQPDGSAQELAGRDRDRELVAATQLRGGLEIEAYRALLGHGEPPAAASRASSGIEQLDRQAAVGRHRQDSGSRYQ